MLELDKKIVVLAVIITILFSSYILVNNNVNTNNNLNNKYSPNTYEFYLFATYYITGINLINHYIYLNQTEIQNGVITYTALGISNNATWASETANAYGYPIINGQIVFKFYDNLPASSTSPIVLTNTFIVFNNSVSFNFKTYNPNQADVYYQPTITSFTYNITYGTPLTTTQNLNYYNNVKLQPIGYAEFSSNNLFNLTINNVKYTNVNNFNITLPVGSYSYSAEYNNTTINGTVYINNIGKQRIYINFQRFAIANNYIFLAFIFGTTIIALLFAYYLNRNFYAFFTIELLFLFIGYQANIPFISISFFALLLFFMVFLIVYKVILE